jgi:hypothetical protein
MGTLFDRSVRTGLRMDGTRLRQANSTELAECPSAFFPRSHKLWRTRQCGRLYATPPHTPRLKSGEDRRYQHG